MSDDWLDRQQIDRSQVKAHYRQQEDRSQVKAQYRQQEDRSQVKKQDSGIEIDIR